MDSTLNKTPQKNTEIHTVAKGLSEKGTVTLKGNKMTFVVDNLAEKIKKSTRLLSDDESSQYTSNCSSPSTSDWSEIPAVDGDVLDALEVHTKQLSKSVDTVLENLKKRLHEASAITVGYCQTYSDGSADMGTEADEAIRSMYMLIAHCEELDRAMEPVHKVAKKIKHIKTILSALEAQVT